MNISNEILKIRNRLYTKARIEVKTEEDPAIHKYPGKFKVTNKKTGEAWTVELDIKRDNDEGISPDKWYAQLKDSSGKLLETRDISRNLLDPKSIDRIYDGDSGYEPIWDAVNTEFKKFQKEHVRIESNKFKSDCDAKNVAAMKKLRTFLKSRD